MLQPGYSADKVRHVCVLSNVEKQPFMRDACTFPRPRQLFGSGERLNFLDGFQSQLHKQMLVPVVEME